jgi:hypothetical protein
VLKIGAIGITAVAIFGFIVMSLWNWLAPAVIGARPVNFWQALGILVLSKILFGGFRGRPGHGIRWQRRMSDRWEQMNPEEREKFRQAMARRCGRGSIAVQESGKTI